MAASPAVESIGVCNSNKHTHRGWLVKQGGSTKSWRRRYFLLEGYQMSYYKNNSQTTPLGTISLNGCSVQAADHLKKDNCFQIYHPIRRTFFMYTDTQEEMLAWMEALRKHIPKHDTSMQEYKIVMLGAGGVGKSALTIQLVHNLFMKEYEPTIEDSFLKQVNIDGETCRLSILDTAGQEEYWTITDQYIDVGNGFIVVYDVTNRESFDELHKLREKIVLVKDDQNTPTMFVGNKIDLVNERAVSTEEGQARADQHGVDFLETSALTRTNVETIFHEVVRTIRARESPAEPTPDSGGGRCRQS